MQDLFDFLYNELVTPNGWYVLGQLAAELPFKKNYVNYHSELQRLRLTGHVCQASTECGHTLTLKGRQLVDEAEQKLASASKSKKVRAVPFEQWEANIGQYLGLFPRGSQGSAPIRSPAKSLYERFKWFFVTYPDYDWNLVLRATDAYLTQLENSPEGFKYLSTSKYFIKKQEGDKTNLSRLADWCQAVLDGTTQPLSDQGHSTTESYTV